MLVIRDRKRPSVYLPRVMITVIILRHVRFHSMRGTQPEGDTLYECMDCGDRQRDPEGRLCACGGYLKNIGIERSL
jgi:hypothetical protein